MFMDAAENPMAQQAAAIAINLAVPHGLLLPNAHIIEKPLDLALWLRNEGSAKHSLAQP